MFALLAEDPAQRPADAFIARQMLRGLKWPATIERVSIPRPRPKMPSERPSGRAPPPRREWAEIDQWLGRKVVSVPLDAASLARASLFARADHPALQPVLRVDRLGGAIWLAVPRGAPLAARLDRAQTALVREAVDRLHELGQAHGAIDPEHVLVDELGSVTLAFAAAPGPTATFDLDRLALARLGS